MFSKKLFAQRVQEIRKSHHETQKELGEIISTRATNISEIESGRKTTTTEKLALICHPKVRNDAAVSPLQAGRRR